MTRIVIADDQALVRKAFTLLLQSEPGLEVAGEAANGEEAVDLARSQRPDVVLMDIRMPVMDGLEATRRIAADPELTAVHVLVLTTFEADDYIFGALRAGASGFVLKDIEPVELLRAIKVVADLTEREKEVVALVAAGKSNDEIATELFLSPATVKTHVSRAMSKVYARDRAQLVVFAYESGLVVPGG